MGYAAHGSELVIKDLIPAFSLKLVDGTHAEVIVLLGKLVQESGDHPGCLGGKTGPLEI